MRWDGKKCNIILEEYRYTRKIGMEYPTRQAVCVLFVSVEDTQYTLMRKFRLMYVLPAAGPSVCRLVGLPACQPACLSACLPACLPACLSACLSACLPSCLSRALAF